MRQQERDQLSSILAGIPGGGGSVGGVNLADVLSSQNPALQNVGGALLQSQLRGDEDLLSPEAFAQQDALRRSGRPSTSVNVGGSTVNLSPAATTSVQKDVLATQDLKSRLDSISSGFRPEFLTLEGQFAQGVNAFRERALESFGIAELSPEQRESLTAFTTFKRDTVNNLSLFVAELSGAAVTPQEAERLAGSLPTIDDSPTQFQAKLNSSIRDANRALARASFALNQGLNPLNSGISLEGIEARMATEESRLRSELSTTLPPDQVEAEVERRLRALFGL
ncbi:MAG: hypothetical protein ACR2RF_26380 [Geminicoccaceae bacterium]